MTIKIKQDVKTLPCGTCECMAKGCDAKAKYRAPKSPDELGSYYYFCLKHVRQYNSQWDFFTGKEREEIERFQKESMLGHRKTRTSGVGSASYEKVQNIDEELRKIFSRVNKRKEHIAKQTRTLTEEHKQALKVLELDASATWDAIKTQYKKLAKSYHPDINDDSDGEMLKRINQAYSTLKVIYQ